MNEDTVAVLRDGTFEFRISGMEIRVPAQQGIALCIKGLQLSGYTQAQEMGLQVGDAEAKAMEPLQITNQIEKLRASGVGLLAARKQRLVLQGPWTAPSDEAPPPAPKQRRFVKEPAARVTVKVPVKTARKAPAAAPRDVATMFSDPGEQLRYEIRHEYLTSVPESQRQQWPLDESYVLLDAFIADVEEQQKVVSRAQIITALVDIVSGRGADSNARKIRPFREGSGESHRPVRTRSDGALAWRANLQAGTPAARRIMWWRNNENRIEFARLTTHDDMEMK